MRKVWTIAEESKLKSVYTSLNKEDLVNLFNTSWPKIKDKAINLGGLNRQKINIDEMALIADYNSTLPLKDILKKYDISNPSLITIINKHNVHKRNCNLNTIDTAQFTADYAKLTMAELTNKYSASKPTIRNKANELKLVRPCMFLHKTSKLSNNEEEICNKYKNDKVSMYILANEYKVSTGVIFNILHKHGIEINKGIYGAAENEIGKWLKSTTNLDFVSNRTVLDGKEIDLYNDELKIGIEYCGLFWHSEYFKTDNNYHYDKYKMASDKEIHLITIFEDEWINRKEQVKGVLLSILQKNSRRLYARKCIVKMIDKSAGSKFYDEYHIQGKANLGKYFAGLYYNDELVGVMSFGQHHRDIGKHTLDRLCFKYDVSVAGGAAKLFKFLLTESGITNLISWSDNRWFMGKVYDKLGFTKDQDMKPDYSYVNINKQCVRLSKQSQKKDNTNCPGNMTEKQWSMKNDLYRIWDCGKKRWIWTRK